MSLWSPFGIVLLVVALAVLLMSRRREVRRSRFDGPWWPRHLHKWAYHVTASTGQAHSWHQQARAWQDQHLWCRSKKHRAQWQSGCGTGHRSRRSGKACGGKRGGGFWLFLLIAGGVAWLVFGSHFAAHQETRERRIAWEHRDEARRRQQEAVARFHEKWDWMHHIDESHSSRGVGPATVEIQMLADQLAAEGIGDSDVVATLEAVFARLAEGGSEDGKPQVVSLSALNEVIVRDDELGVVRLGDVARVSRRRLPGRTAWHDTQLVIRFDDDGPDDAPTGESVYDELEERSEDEDQLELAGWRLIDDDDDDDRLVWRIDAERLPSAEIIPTEALAANDSATLDTTEEIDTQEETEEAVEPKVEQNVATDDEVAADDLPPAVEPEQVEPTAESAASATPTESTPAPTAEAVAAGPSNVTATRPPDSPPEWLERTSRFSDGVYYLYATDGPFIDRRQCEEALPELLRRRTAEYVREYLGLGNDVALAVSPHYIQSEIVKEVWIGPWQEESSGVLPTSEPFDRYGLYVAMEFDDADRAYFANIWRQQQVTDRVWATAIASGVLLSLMGIVFGYLKLDTMTRGYYSGRLKLAAAGAATAAVGAAVWLTA